MCVGVHAKRAEVEQFGRRRGDFWWQLLAIMPLPDHAWRPGGRHGGRRKVQVIATGPVLDGPISAGSKDASWFELLPTPSGQTDPNLRFDLMKETLIVSITRQQNSHRHRSESGGVKATVKFTAKAPDPLRNRPHCSIYVSMAQFISTPGTYFVSVVCDKDEIRA